MEKNHQITSVSGGKEVPLEGMNDEKDMYGDEIDLKGGQHDVQVLSAGEEATAKKWVLQHIC